MKTPVISILTDWGPLLGQGHIQRMTTLATYLRERGIESYIVNERAPDFLPESIHEIFSPDIKPGSRLIIRDMRDSAVEEIEKLKKQCPVLVIDDLGKGREHSDFAIDLLPRPEKGATGSWDFDRFIYGYEFTEFMTRVTCAEFTKDINVTLYTGLENDRGLLKRLYKPLSELTDIFVLSGKGQYIYSAGTLAVVKEERPYPEILLRSKALITHFGITLFEGYIAGCGLITVDPTNYHHILSLNVGKELPVKSLGVQDGVDPATIYRSVTEYLNSGRDHSLKHTDLASMVSNKLDSFYQFLKKQCL